jgi:beta-lactamase class A
MRKLIGVISILFLPALITYIVLNAILPANTSIVSPLTINETPTKSPSSVTILFGGKNNNKNPEELKKKIKEMVGTTWVNYSVVVKDLNSDFTMSLNDSVIFTAASINKIPILATLYYKAQKNEIDLDKTITLQKKDIQDYGTGSIRYDKPGSVYSIKTLAQLMIQSSDNTAAYILGTNIIGLDTVQELVDSWGLVQTNMENNKTSNHDMEIIMEKIFEGDIAGAAFTQEMLAYFKDTDFESRIPALLPQGTTVYHKIGTEVGKLHDLGIVVSPKSTYYIGIFTNDITSDEQTEELESKLSKLVYDFMQ